MHNTMRIVLAVSIIDAPINFTREEEEAMMERVLNAVIPHPDSVIATEKAGEKVTVLATEYEMTS